MDIHLLYGVIEVTIRQVTGRYRLYFHLRGLNDLSYNVTQLFLNITLVLLVVVDLTLFVSTQ